MYNKLLVVDCINKKLKGCHVCGTVCGLKKNVEING